jgi:pyruvate dehydrogenase E2 component (dihydrolipoamide acetyltransferase)
MEEGTLVRWLKAEGDTVSKGEPIAEILTDKANMEVESPGAGRLHLVAAEGAVVPILEVIGQVLEEGEDASSLAAGAPAPAGAAPAEPGASAAPAAPGATAAGAVSVTSAAGGRLRISPAARRVARELNVAESALAGLAGTGPGGRIIIEDVRRFAAQPAVAAPVAAAPAVATPAAAAPVPAAPVPVSASAGEVKVIPLTGVRGIIAERLTRSVREAPQFHVSADIMMDQLIALRDELLPVLERDFRIRLSYTDLMIKAVARALEAYPVLNSFVSSEAITVQPQVNLGVAVGAEQGMVVPVIQDAAARSLAEVAADLKRLAASARRGSLSLADLSGGTFTLSNLGMYGVSSFAAIVNPPQAGILAVGGTREELRPEGRGIAVRRVASFTITCDHRAVDGVMAAQFLGRLKEIIEGPELREVCRP